MRAITAAIVLVGFLLATEANATTPIVFGQSDTNKRKLLRPQSQL